MRAWTGRRRRRLRDAVLSGPDGERYRTAIEKRRLVEQLAASQFWLLFGQRSLYLPLLHSQKKGALLLLMQMRPPEVRVSQLLLHELPNSALP